MKKKLLTEIRGLLAFHQDLGLGTYPRSPELKTFLDQSHPEKTTIGPTPGQLSGKLTLEEIKTEISGCSHCQLHKSRSNIVFGDGSAESGLLIVGEWPNREDDNSSRPFSGEEGELLAKMLTAIDLDRKNVFITNLVKCSPPEGSQPQPREISTCFPYLIRQIELVSPRIICTMGTLAAQVLTSSNKSLLQLRGRIHKFKLSQGRDIALMPTFHPAFLLKNIEMKKGSWKDLQTIQKYLGKKK